MTAKSTTKRAPRRDGGGAPDLTNRQTASATEVAKVYGVSRAWLYDHMAEPGDDDATKLRSYRIDGRRFIRVADAEAFFLGETGAPGGDAA